MSFLSFLSKEMHRILLTIVVLVFLGSITQSWLFSFCLGIFCYTIWLYFKVFQLSVWLESDLDDFSRPLGDGIWERITFLIHQADKKSKSRKAKKNILLKHFQGIVKGLPFATVLLNSNNEIEWSNSMSAELLNIKSKTDRGQRIDHLLRDPKFQTILNNPSKREFEMISPYDSKIILSFRILPIQVSSKLLIVRDITDRAKLIERQKNFIDNASHELKTPLTSIYGYIDIMRSNKNIEDDEKEMLDEVFMQAQSMVELIDDLLFLSKVESEASLRSLFEAVSMESLINKVIIKHINITTAIEKELYIDAIKVEIISLVKNIVDNAIKHNPEGTKIEVKWHKDKSGRPCFEVRDYGLSIPQKDLARVTEKFYRVSDKSFQTNGSGLGLSIVKSIAKRHEAELEIISKKDFGTSVIIKFPAHRILQSTD